MVNAGKLGSDAFSEFVEKCIHSSEVSFYASIKTFSLKSFKHLRVKKSIKLKGKSVTLAAERSMFGP